MIVSIALGYHIISTLGIRQYSVEHGASVSISTLRYPDANTELVWSFL